MYVYVYSIFLMHSAAILRSLTGQGFPVMPQGFPAPPEVTKGDPMWDRRLPQVLYIQMIQMIRMIRMIQMI